MKKKMKNQWKWEYNTGWRCWTFPKQYFVIEIIQCLSVPVHFSVLQLAGTAEL